MKETKAMAERSASEGTSTQKDASRQEKKTSTWRRPLIAFIVALIALGGFAWAWTNKTNGDKAKSLADCRSARSAAVARQISYQAAVAQAKKTLAASHSEEADDPEALKELAALAAQPQPAASIVECQADGGMADLDAAAKANRKSAATLSAATRKITAAQDALETGAVRRR